MISVKKILLVEDDPLLIRMCSTKFRRDGFAVELAHDGEEGLKKAEKIKPDLILLDIMMPKVNGYEMLKMLRAKKTMTSIPVIILSSIGDDLELIEKTKNLGVADIVVKGNISPQEVVKKMREALSKKK